MTVASNTGGFDAVLVGIIDGEDVKVKGKKLKGKSTFVGTVPTKVIPNNMTASTIDVCGGATLRSLVGKVGPCGLCKLMVPVVMTTV